MTNTAELLINVKANASQATAVISELQMQTRQLEQIMANTTRATSSSSSATSGAMGLASAAAFIEMKRAGDQLTGTLGDAVQSAASFDTMLVQTRNNTMMTTADMDTMRQSILGMATEGGVSLTTLADAFRHIENFGFDAAASTKILEAAMRSAVSTGGDTADTANVLASVMKEFRLSADQASTAMDKIHLAAAQGNMTLEEFVGSFGQVGAIASSVGIPLDQAAAAMSALTRHGFDPSTAATQIRGMLTHMLNPSASAQGELNKLSNASGLDVTKAFSPQTLNSVGLTGVIDEINTAMHKANMTMDQQTAEWLKLIPNMRGGVAAFVLAGNGASDYAQILASMNQQMGITDDAFQRMQQTPGQQWNVLKAQVEVLGIALGDTLLPTAIALVVGLQQLVTAASQLPAPILQVVGVAGSLAGGLLVLGGTLGLASFAISNLKVAFAALLPTSEATEIGIEGVGVAASTTAGALAGVVGVIGMFAAAVYIFSQPLRDAIDDLYQLKAAADALPRDQMNPIQRFVADQLDKLPDHSAAQASDPIAQAKAQITARSGSAAPDLQTYEIPEVKTAKTAADNAKSNLQEIEDAAAQRKADFDVAHIGAEQQALGLKIQQTEAEQQLLGYKRQIEDIDRAALDYAQQRKDLDDQDSVTMAKLSGNPLSDKNDDITYRENLIKAQLAASRAAGETGNGDAARQQLRDLEKQKAALQPALLQAQHNVDLANRQQSADSEQKSLHDNATNRAKLAVNEASQPIADQVTQAQRANQDAQQLLDLEKQRFDLSERAYQTQLLLAQAQEKAAEHTLQLLQQPASATEGPPSPNVTQSSSSPSLAEQHRLAQKDADYVQSVQVNVDVTHTGDEDSLLDKVIAKLRLAWDSAKASNPVTGQVGGNYAGVAGR